MPVTRQHSYPMSGEVRVWLGGALSAAGMVCWSLAQFVFGPATTLTYGTLAAQNKPDHWVTVNWEDLAQMVLWGKDLRWASLVLALGGLLLIVTGRARLYVFSGVLLWLGADLYLDRIGASGWVAAMLALALLAVVLAGTLLTAGSRTRRQPKDRGNAAIVFYSGVACALAPLMFWVEPSTKTHRPQGMLLMAAVLSASLVAAAMATALTAAEGPKQGVLAVTGVIAAAMIAAEVTSASLHGDEAQTMLLRLLPYAGIPVLVTCLLIVVNGRPTSPGWFGYGFLAILSGIIVGFGLLGGVIAGYTMQDKLMELTGEMSLYEGFPLSGSGLAGGIGAGLVAWIAATIHRNVSVAQARPGSANPYRAATSIDEAFS